MASTAATVYWWGVWALAAGAVLVWRVGLPVWRNARHRLRVTSVVHEADGIVSVYVTGHRLDRLRAEAGQFFGWRFLDRAGWTRRQPVLPVGRARTAAACGSPPRTSATAAPPCGTCGPARACSSRGPSGGSRTGPGPGAASCSSAPASG